MTESLNRQLEVRPDHWCFGCGRQNPIGLQLTFFEQPDGVVYADWTPARVHQGYEGIVHGGMITTILDEVMGWATSARQLWAVTGTINVRFRKPVEIGDALRARAWVASVTGRKVDVQAELVRRSDSVVLASGTAIFIRVSEDQAANWQNRYITDSAD
ncbi:MAG TPA: PaaI family thioesterase [Thermomicrobiales bacterium]|nr:PaaI family thioesterase [Thermomicrobiales bacterium]